MTALCPSCMGPLESLELSGQRQALLCDNCNAVVDASLLPVPVPAYPVSSEDRREQEDR